MSSKKKTKRKAKRMSEAEAPAKDPELEAIKEKADLKNEVFFSIEGTGDGQTIHVSLRAPKLADIIAKMTPGNYPKERFDESYQPILQAIALGENPTDAQKEIAKRNIVTRPAITKITKNFVGELDWDWEGPPRAVLLYNPEALIKGFTLIRKLEKPVPPEVLRRWGKQVVDGIADIIQNAKPFRMTWTSQEVPK